MSRHENFFRSDQPNQKSAAFRKYVTSCHDIQLLIDKLNPAGLILNALKEVTSWRYHRGSQGQDAHLSIWIKKAVKPLFTAGVHNKILSLMRKNYNQVVLIQYNIIDEYGTIRPEKVTDND